LESGKLESWKVGKLESGKWKVESGKWKVQSGKWKRLKVLGNNIKEFIN